MSDLYEQAPTWLVCKQVHVDEYRRKTTQTREMANSFLEGSQAAKARFHRSRAVLKVPPCTPVSPLNCFCLGDGRYKLPSSIIANHSKYCTLIVLEVDEYPRAVNRFSESSGCRESYRIQKKQAGNFTSKARSRVLVVRN